MYGVPVTPQEKHGHGQYSGGWAGVLLVAMTPTL